MRKALFIILFSLISFCHLVAQDIHQIKEHADRQYLLGNHVIALKEYQRVLLFDEKGDHGYLYAKIASIYDQLEDFENAVVYYDLAWRAVGQDSLKIEYALAKALCYFKSDQYLLGLTELLDLPDPPTPYFEDKKSLYFAICHFGLGDHAQALQYFSEIADSAALAKIDSTLVALNEFTKKYDPDKLELMSIFLPGLGQAYAGEYGSALNSLLLLSGITAYAYHTMRTYTFLDGLLVLISWFYRYYTGGHRKAHEIGTRLSDAKRIEVYGEIIKIIQNNAPPG